MTDIKPESKVRETKVSFTYVTTSDWERSCLNGAMGRRSELQESLSDAISRFCIKKIDAKLLSVRLYHAEYENKNKAKDPLVLDPRGSIPPEKLAKTKEDLYEKVKLLLPCSATDTSERKAEAQPDLHINDLTVEQKWELHTDGRGNFTLGRNGPRVIFPNPPSVLLND